MLLSIASRLRNDRIVLASTSPRRAEILRNVNFPFEVVPSQFDESTIKWRDFKEPSEYVTEVARSKTSAVVEILKLDQVVKVPADLIIGADTSITLDGHVYGKPVDEDDAVAVLSRLSNRVHTVYTGVVLMKYSKEKESYTTHTFHEATDVEFGELSEQIIREYVKTKDPMDKAGGYGCQSLGGTFIKAFHGDYFNVMGFPLHHFCKKILEIYEE